MEAIRVDAVVASGGTLTLRGLPLREGEQVQVSITPKVSNASAPSHPLRGLPVTYLDPFEPATSPYDWEAGHDRP
jgi:hypothetical protein